MRTRILSLSLGMAVAASLLCSAAYAGTDTVSYAAPTQCDDGSAVSNCAVTGYRAEVSATPTGPWVDAGTANANTLTMTFTGTLAGTRCYRVFAQSLGGDSDPSNVACKTQKPIPKKLTITVN